MAPFPGDRVRPRQDGAVDDQAGTGSGADDGGEHDTGAGGGAIDGLGQCEAVGVIGDANGAVERGGQVEVQRLADQERGICVFDDPCGGRDGAGYGNPDRTPCSDRRLHGRHQPSDRIDGRGIVARRCGNAAACPDATVVADGNGLDFGAAEIDADPHGGKAESDFGLRPRLFDRMRSGPCPPGRLMPSRSAVPPEV